MLNTPVLFLVFNRPETTRRVFEAIRQAEPRQLFVAADGPRIGKGDEAEKCAEVRRIATAVNWPCEVITLFREKNLGCGLAVNQAITWFFEHVEEGIILEDDTLPVKSFFGFCEKMLQQYRAEEKVFMVAGTNHLLSKVRSKETYYFSSIISIWGWATWRRAWQSNNNCFSNFDSELIYSRYKSKIYSRYIIQMLDDTLKKRLDTWDVQWAYNIIKNDAVVVVPYKNQISNIGFRGTHTSSTNERHVFFEMPTEVIDLERIVGPNQIKINLNVDVKDCQIIIKYEGLNESVIQRIKSLLPISVRNFYRQLKIYVTN